LGDRPRETRNAKNQDPITKIKGGVWDLVLGSWFLGFGIFLAISLSHRDRSGSTKSQIRRTNLSGRFGIWFLVLRISALGHGAVIPLVGSLSYSDCQQIYRLTLEVCGEGQTMSQLCRPY
jgi:hypothetical protein